MTEICRRLDGIPLAIEIAASRVDTFGVAGLAAGLNDRFQLLMQGRRTALPRHRTLSATLDWSYSQLSEVERLVLHRLATFVGAFTMEAAIASSRASRHRRGGDRRGHRQPRCQVARLGRRRRRGPLLPAVRRHADLCPGEARGKRRAQQHRAETRRILQERAREGAGRLGDQAGSRVAAAPSATDRQRAGGARLGILAGRRSRDRRRDYGRSGAALVRAVAYERVRRAHRQSAGRTLLQPRRAERDAPPRNARLVTDADAGACTRNARCLDACSRTVGAAGRRRLSAARPCGGFGPDFSTETSSAPRWSLPNGFRRWRRRHSRSADVLVGERMIGYIVHLMGDQTRARRHLERMLERLRGAGDGRRRSSASCSTSARPPSAFLHASCGSRDLADQATSLTKEIVDTAHCRR